MHMSSMTKILAGGAVAFVAVLAFVFGQDVSIKQSETTVAQVAGLPDVTQARGQGKKPENKLPPQQKETVKLPGNNGTAPDVGPGPCTCPYTVMVIGGKGGDLNNPFYKWMDANVKGFQHLPLADANDDGKGASDVSPEIVNGVKRLVKEQLGQKNKILLIGYSLGGSVAFNIAKELDSKKSCIETFLIDPTSTCHAAIPDNGFGQFFARLARNDADQICKATNGGMMNDKANIVDWTQGQGADTKTGVHFPFDKTDAQSKRQLVALKAAIDAKIKACKNTNAVQVN